MSSMMRHILSPVITTCTILFMCGFIFTSFFLHYDTVYKDEFALFCQTIEHHDESDYTTQIFDHKGTLYDTLSPAEKRQSVPLHEIPKPLIDAFLIAEDQNFYAHFGINILSLIRAFIYNTLKGQWTTNPIGASTITQQVVKNFLLNRQRTFDRKIKEIIFALKLENTIPKDKILEFYLNHIYMGRQSFGVAAAAHVYFKKPLYQLNLSECAYLASLPKAPSSYQSTKDLPKALDRRNWILRRLFEEKFIPFHVYKIAITSPLDLFSRIDSFSHQPKKTYANLEIQREILKIFPKSCLHRDSMHIFSTLDRTLQAHTESILTNALYNLEKSLASPSSQKKSHRDQLTGGIVIMDAQSGGILALSGGVDPTQIAFNSATQAKRQTGSAFKPFVYATALEAGYTPESLIDDNPIQISLHGRKKTIYAPKNYGYQQFGLTPLATGLAQSRNQMTVRLAKDIGIPKIVNLSKRLGLSIRHTTHDHFSLALGATEHSLVNLVAAYAPFVNGGKRVTHHLIHRIYNHRGAILFDHDTLDYNPYVLSWKVANTMESMLHGVIEHGTGKVLHPLEQTYGVRIGGKTGTSNDSKDVWFVGYVTFPNGKTFLIGVFVGYMHPKSLGKKATGASIAIPIAQTILTKLIAMHL